MAEKRVSVRLAATGGRQVRAELEGVGEAGKRGFGRLSEEMEAANRRLAGFARRVRVASAAAVAAATAAGVAMVRSGLQTVDAQAKLAQSLGTTVASIQTLERAGELAGVAMSGIEQATKDLTRRLSQAAAGTGPAADALDRLGLSATDLIALPLDQRVGAINAAIEDFVPSAERAAVAGQLFGEEGSIAMSRIDTATLRQATQDVRDFGVVVSEQDAARIERTNDAISRLGLVWRGLSNQLAVAAAPALEAVAEAMAAVARTTGPLGQAIQGLFANLGRLASIAGSFAAFLAGRWVAGMAAAALSVRGLATALVVLRGALIRTGIGAAIVGAGELIYQFTRLVAATGSIGAALGLLKDVAAEAWDRIALRAGAAWARVEAGWAAAQASIYDGLQGATGAVTSWANTTVGAFKGAFDAVTSTWGALPGTIGDFAFGAANGLIAGVEAMLNGVVRRINAFIGGLNAALNLLPDWAVGEGGVQIGTLDPVDLGSLDNPFAGAANRMAGDMAQAFEAAMSRTWLETPDLFGDAAEAARGRADGYREAAGMLSGAASRPMTAWQALRDMVRGVGRDSAAALEETAVAADGVTTALDESAGAARTAGSATQTAARQASSGWQAASDVLARYAQSAMTTGQQIGAALGRAFKGAEDALVAFVTKGRMDFRALADSIMADITRIAVRSAITGPLANWVSGLGGGGSLLAGIFHSGGLVGAPALTRPVPALAFAGAPRMHDGGLAGLRHDEVPAILQRGEMVLSRRQLAAASRSRDSEQQRPVQVVMNVTTPDASSFRRSQGQISADLSRALQRAQRNM
ncbi:phage tail tape measure C-terminal domain-containing protein [Roseovarius tibetensis]|uniref:phage tail tape measure C-terminal domain-containing protein n=1 Tax=Roseovarius tibetensis TaxID=2685897 RepID=UPI003D7FF30C